MSLNQLNESIEEIKREYAEAPRSKAGHRRMSASWRAKVGEVFQKSDLSEKRFSQETRIPLKRLQAWKSKTSPASEKTPGSFFQAVEIEKPSCEASLTMVWKNGMEIHGLSMENLLFLLERFSC